MSLQFTSLDEAFSPLSLKRKRERSPPEALEKNSEQRTHVQQPPQAVTAQAVTAQAITAQDEHRSIIDELAVVQPYLNNLFMLFVLGMLYDIRQTATECKMQLFKK